jgi:hypothetical protein
MVSWSRPAARVSTSETPNSSRRIDITALGCSTYGGDAVAPELMLVFPAGEGLGGGEQPLSIAFGHGTEYLRRGGESIKTRKKTLLHN